MDFKAGDRVAFAKLVWRGRAVLFTGKVLRTTPKTLVVTDVSDGENVTEMLYFYKQKKELRVDKCKAILIEDLK